LANDVAYLPTAAFNGRLRGDFLNLTAVLCGNRFGRNFIRPGGVTFDIDENMAKDILKKLKIIKKQVTQAVDLLWDVNSVLDRFEGTGDITKEIALRLGLVGPAARACGIERDVRYDHPSGLYRFVQVPVSSYPTGDVFARAFVRSLEIKRSIQFIEDQLSALPPAPSPAVIPPGLGKSTRLPLAEERLVVSLVEGWRGEICHTIITNQQGDFLHYKIVDPSFHNWMGLAIALRDEEISNFPLCNKSFNLSYCGFDL
jgi:Ni,Fe-hydrogenase III large subunit